MTQLAKQTVARMNVSHQSANAQIYHACIQKSASQWVMQVLSDPVVLRFSGLPVYNPGKNFIKPRDYPELQVQFPTPRIISPLYITHDDFERMPKPAAWRAFWIMRDLRDVVCSKYFSVRYSHPVNNDGLATLREKLSHQTKDEGIMHFITSMAREQNRQMEAIRSWMGAAGDGRILICRYEEMVGQEQFAAWRKIFDHCDIRLSDTDLRELLERYSFQKLSGREQGSEDTNAHLRKGVAGDWKNHFTEEHKQAFREATGDLLQITGYETQTVW